LYYWYAYMTNNLLHADMTLTMLLYYVGLSITNKLLGVDYQAVILHWWNKPCKKNRKYGKKVKHGIKHQLMHTTVMSGREKANIKYKFRKTQSGHQQGKWRNALYVLYSYFCKGTSSTRIRNTDRLLYACFSTSTVTDIRAKEVTESNENSTETYDSDSTWIGIDSLSTYCITNSLHNYIGMPAPIRQNIKGINNTPAQITGEKADINYWITRDDSTRLSSTNYTTVQLLP
jgi:hypothetical protein